MAKNKNRKSASQQDRSQAAAERAQEQSKSAAFESKAGLESQAQGSPADVARKHQRRFGHN